MKLPIIEWYQNIPDPEIREKAIAECNAGNLRNGVDVYSQKSPQDAIGCLDWDETQDGYAYWYLIHEKIAPTWPIPEKVSEVNEAVEFVDWIMKENIVENAFRSKVWDYNGTDYTTSELYQIYKSQK